MSSEIPRRADLRRNTYTEIMIRDIIGNVEELGAHPLLTDAVVLLQQAREKVADWVDLKGDAMNDDYCETMGKGGCDVLGKEKAAHANQGRSESMTAYHANKMPEAPAAQGKDDMATERKGGY